MNDRAPLADWLDSLNRCGGKYPSDAEIRAFLEGVSYGKVGIREFEQLQDLLQMASREIDRLSRAAREV